MSRNKVVKQLCHEKWLKAANKSSLNEYLKGIPFSENSNSYADREKMLRVLEMSLEELTQIQRRIIHSVFWEGKEISEIAKELDKDLDDVGSMVTNALTKIKTILLENINRNIIDEPMQ